MSRVSLLRDDPLRLLPPEIVGERSVVLHRALRGLPLTLLEPLLRGLRRHADSLVPGHLVAGNGGCALGVMLRELSADRSWQASGALPPRRRRRGASAHDPSIYETWPQLSKAYPRLPHVEIIFDATCEELAQRTDLSEKDIPRMVGLWMAAETQSEINMRHLEETAAQAAASMPSRSVPLDERLFAATVDRLIELRPSLSRAEATTAVEGLVGARRLEADPLYMPAAWEHELELQQGRLALARKPLGDASQGLHARFELDDAGGQTIQRGQ